MKTILIILSLILIVFFLSEDKKLNNIMRKQSVPFIIILLLFYFFFNKIDIKVIAFALVIMLILCSDIFSKTNLIIENLKLVGNSDLEIEQVQQVQQEDLVGDEESDKIKEAFNYEELHGMFTELDEQINNK